MLPVRPRPRTFSLLLMAALCGLPGCGGGGGSRPGVASVQPAAGAPGTTVALAGSGLGAAVDVQLGAIDLPIATQSDGQITFVLPAWMPSGSWPVQLPLADGSRLTAATDFQALAPEPELTGLSPASGAAGQRVFLEGANFPPTGLAVSFGGVAAAIESVQDHLVTAVVPQGAASGPVQVTAPAGSATASASFQVALQAGSPEIFNLAPSEAAPGVSINIYGYRLQGTTAVAFGGGVTAPASACIDDDQEWVQVTVPAGAASGYLTLLAKGGSAVSSEPFTVLPPATAAPVITAITPTATFEDQYIFLTGSNLSPVTQATVGGQAVDFIRYSDTELELYPAPNGALVSGPVVLTAPQGQGTAPGPFTLLPRVPEVASLMPRSGGPGTAVVVSGSNLDQVAAVRFGGIATTTIENRAEDRTRFTVPLPAGAQTGPVTLTTLNGTTVPVAGSFTVGTGAPLAYALEKAYLTQGIQDGSVSLVTGKPAVFRAFALANQANSARPTVRVTLANGGATVFTRDLPGPAAGVPQNLDPNALGSYTVAVPGSLIQPGLTLLAELLPDPLAPPAPGTPASFPLSGTPMPLVVQAYPALDLVLRPVQYRSSADGPAVTGQLDQPLASWRAPLLALFPLSTVNLSVGPTLVTDVVLQDGDYGAIEALQAAVEVARQATPGAAYQNWHGVFALPPEGASSGYGLPGTPGSPLNRSSVGFDGTFSSSYGYAQVLAHELGHTKGRAHAPCGGAGEPDPRYPYPPARLGGAAFDVANGTPVDNLSTFDLMGYCDPYWISVYTYQGLQTWFLADQAARAAVPAAQLQDSLAVSGRIRDGVVVLDPALEFQGMPETPAPGPYTLRCLDSAGGTLLAVPFQPGQGDGHAQSFALLLPMSPALKAGLASLQVEAPAARSARPAGARRDRAALALTREPVAVAWGPGTVHLGWDHGSHPRVLVRDPAGQVLAVAGGGSVELATTARKLELLLSDGVRTTVRHVAVGP